MRFQPVMPIKSQSGRIGVLFLPGSDRELDELREANKELREMNEHLRKEVKELRRRLRS